MSELQRGLLKNKLPPLPNPYRTGPDGQFRLPNKRRKDYSPIAWDKYFDECKDVPVKENTFRVYSKGKDGPVLLLLHGGGFSALSWAVFCEEIASLCHCQAIAFDFRGHGCTHTDNDEYLGADVLARDVTDLIEALFGEKPPPIVLMRHSMGGAIAVHAAAGGLLHTLCGLVVIDVVEGTAMDALSAMQSFLRGRPQVFPSLEHAIEWSVRSGQIKNLESARISMPGQLVRIKKSEHEGGQSCEDYVHDLANASADNTIREEGEGEVGRPSEHGAGMSNQAEEVVEPRKEDKAKTPKDEYVYRWRIDLTKTEQYWEGWFKSMSQLFLSVPVPKLLLLAGIERLDKDLCVGQMQGKFQMQVLQHCGHAVHEDAPHKVAEVLVGFLMRNKVAEPKGDFERVMPSC